MGCRRCSMEVLGFQISIINMIWKRVLIVLSDMSWWFFFHFGMLFFDWVDINTRGWKIIGFSWVKIRCFFKAIHSCCCCNWTYCCFLSYLLLCCPLFLYDFPNKLQQQKEKLSSQLKNYSCFSKIIFKTL